MSGPYVIVERRVMPAATTRAECVALALLALQWLDRIDVLLGEAIARCEKGAQQA